MDRMVVLYGAGGIGAGWLDYLGMDKVYAFVDSDEQKVGKTIRGKKVISLDELAAIKDKAAVFISTSYMYKNEIFRMLKDKNMEGCVVGFPMLDKEVYLDWDTYVNVNTVLEGRNALFHGVQLYNCSVGFASYVAINTVLSNVRIGKYTSVGPDVRVIAGQHPTRNFVSTHPVFYSTQRIIRKSYVSENTFDEFRYTKNGWRAEIGNDVWIGCGATIMEGVSIADGTIVAAGANVVKDTEPYSIVGGNPARIIRYRFATEDIEFLHGLKWWDKGEGWIDEHAGYFDDIKKFRKLLGCN